LPLRFYKALTDPTTLKTRGINLLTHLSKLLKSKRQLAADLRKCNKALQLYSTKHCTVMWLPR
jgi:hypothetical protein